MSMKDTKDIAAMEHNIKGMFEKCEVPVKGSKTRVYAILLRGLHELSLRDMIQFISNIIQTMCVLVVGSSKKSPTNGDK